MLANIPEELRRLRQWVAAGPDKVPLNPRTLARASVTDAATWGSFDEARAANTAFVGFVLTASDPYAIIDLDCKPGRTYDQFLHDRILAAFPTYTERSASGLGYHIILRGTLPAGVRRDSVEAYASERYMICTGNVVKALPIVDCNAALQSLTSEMRPRKEIELDDVESDLSDADLVERASLAANGAKFVALCNGDWQKDYPSQSEADFALLSLLAFYTKDNAQVRRLFYYSALGQREKATNSYLDRCLRKIRASEIPAAVIELPPPALIDTPAATPQPAAQLQPPLPWPPGLIGQIAHYIYYSSIRPVSEISLCAAIALTAGIAGRAYNISGTGLNQYLVLLAKTGAGKEGAAKGIDRLISAVRRTVPAADQFIGPGSFASGQALIRTLDERHVFLSVLGEFGFTLKQMTDPRANGATVMLKRVLLDLFSKSGSDSILRASVYSDKEKNTKVLQSPCVSILGESTPESFYEGLTPRHIAEGLLPRFSIIEYKGDRPPTNEAPAVTPDPSLVDALAELAATCLTMQANSSTAIVHCDPPAKALLKAFDVEADAKINGNPHEVERQLWNRAHLKAVKLSALVAVGCCPCNPVVTVELATWAIGFVRREMQDVLDRYSSGDIGDSAGRLDQVVIRSVKEWLGFGEQKRRTAGYEIPEALIKSPWVHYRYLKKRCCRCVDFQQDKRGPVRALKETLEDLVNSGELLQLDRARAVKDYGVRAGLYTVG